MSSCTGPQHEQTVKLQKFSRHVFLTIYVKPRVCIERAEGILISAIDFSLDKLVSDFRVSLSHEDIFLP